MYFLFSVARCLVEGNFDAWQSSVATSSSVGAKHVYFFSSGTCHQSRSCLVLGPSGRLFDIGSRVSCVDHCDGCWLIVHGEVEIACSERRDDDDNCCHPRSSPFLRWCVGSLTVVRLTWVPCHVGAL